MQAVIDYIRLRKAFPDLPEQHPIQVSIDQLGEILFCTPRNVRLIINKLVTNKWIAFFPGRGRGNLSTLTFNISSSDLLLIEASRLTQAGALDKAMEFIREHGQGIVDKHRVISWLNGYFGYTVDQNEEYNFEILRFPIYRNMKSFDPTNSFYAFDIHMVGQVFDTLVQYDRETDSIVPHLAHYWESNQDCTRYVMYLRKGVQFHNGKELIAIDVIRSLSRLKNSDVQNSQSWLLRDVEAFEHLNSHTIGFKLRKSNYLFLRMLSLAATSIVLVESDVSSNAQSLPVGTGAYKFLRHTENFCVLEAFPYYFKGRPNLDRIEIINLAAHSSQNDSLEHQRVTMDEDEVPNQKVPAWVNKEDFHWGSKILTMNQNKIGPLRDARLRESIHRLINRKEMVNDLKGTRLRPSNGFVLSGPTSHIDHQFDPSKARDLLRQSDYQQETLYLYVYERHVADANWIQQQLCQEGIRLKVIVFEWSDLLIPSKIKEADMIIFEANLSDPYLSILEALQSPLSFIRNHLPLKLANDVELKISHMLSLSTDEARQFVLQELELLLKEAYAISFLVYMKLEAAFQPDLYGIKVTPNGWVDFKQLWYMPQVGIDFVISDRTTNNKL